MTEDRALKQAVRRRMQITSEKYTQARRALAGGSGDQRRFAWSYPPYWEELCERYRRLCDEGREAVARAGVYSELHSLQLVFTLSPFQMLAGGRGPTGPDDWLAERPHVEYNAATVDASAPLARVGFAEQLERNRQITERVLTLIDMKSADASQQARDAAQRRRGSVGVQWTPAGGAPSRAIDTAAGRWSDELGHAVVRDDHDHFLRHPRDNAFRGPRRGIDDGVLLGLLDAWLEDLDRNYRELIDTMPSEWREHGELDFVAAAATPDQDDDLPNSGLGHRSPARVRVTRSHRGELRDEEQVATPWVVVGTHLSPQSEGIAIVAADECWHIRGHRLHDGTTMPCLGSHRTSRPS